MMCSSSYLAYYYCLLYKPILFLDNDADSPGYEYMMSTRLNMAVFNVPEKGDETNVIVKNTYQ